MLFFFVSYTSIKLEEKMLKIYQETNQLIKDKPTAPFCVQ